MRTKHERRARCSSCAAQLVVLIIISCAFFLFWRPSYSGLITQGKARRNSAVAAVNVRPPNHAKDVAVVYAVHPFHDEIAAFYSCALHKLGYSVIVYVGWVKYSVTVMDPFENSRIKLSESVYGHCVHEWRSVLVGALHGPLAQSVQLEMTALARLQVLIFVTFPLRYRHSTDQAALSLLKQVHEYGPSAAALEGSGPLMQQLPHIVLTQHAVHPAEKFIEKALHVKALVPQHTVTFMYLSAHTYKAVATQPVPTSAPLPQLEGIDSARRRGEAVNITLGDAFRISFVYPVFPIDHILGGGVDARPRFRNGTAVDDDTMSSLFTVQGNIGPKHAHRKDLQQVFQCIRVLHGLQPALAAPSAIESVQCSAAGDGHAGAEDTLDYSINAPQLSQEVETRSHAETIAIAPLDQQTPVSVLNLVGRVSGVGALTQALPKDYVNVWHDMRLSEFYFTIAKSKFLLTALASDRYCTHRATSSVPTALISRTPLISSRSFLQLYPCLNRAPMHLAVNLNSDCESMSAASRLSEQQYHVLRREVSHCAELWWRHSNLRLQDIISGNWSQHMKSDYQTYNSGKS